MALKAQFKNLRTAPNIRSEIEHRKQRSIESGIYDQRLSNANSDLVSPSMTFMGSTLR